MGKIPSEKVKRLFYRRATWTNQNKDTLENMLKISHDKFKTTSERTFDGHYGNEIKCARYLPKNKFGLFFQIASYVPDQPTSAIDKSSPTSATSNISEVTAPYGKDFLDGDVFVLVSRNNVILLQSGARENVALYYMAKMLEKNSFQEEAMSLEFQRIANEDKMKMIKSQGVKSLELNASLYEASLMCLEYQKNKVNREHRTFNLIGDITESLKQIFASDPTLKEINQKENLNIKLSISFDGKEAMKHKKDVGFGKLGKSRLEKTSLKVLTEYLEEDSDGFTIITGDNNKIKSDEIVISDNYRVKTFGNSLNTNDAFEKLEVYYNELDGQGILTK